MIYSYQELYEHMKLIQAYVSWTCNQTEEEKNMTAAILNKLEELAGKNQDFLDSAITLSTIADTSIEPDFVLSELMTGNKLYTD